MKKRELFSLIYALASPVLIILLGLLLLFSPDSASALVAKLFGWCILVAGFGFGIAAILSRRGNAGKILGAIVCLAAGSWLLANPLILAAGVGRVLGILLLIRGGRDYFLSSRRGGKILSLVTLVTGVVLTVLPMTTSRLVFSLCGLVILLVGIAMLPDKLRRRRLQEDDRDPNIIDAL